MFRTHLWRRWALMGLGSLAVASWGLPVQAQYYHDAEDKVEGFDSGREEQARHRAIQRGVPANNTSDWNDAYTDQYGNVYRQRPNANQAGNRNRSNDSYRNDRNRDPNDRSRNARNRDNSSDRNSADRNSADRNNDRSPDNSGDRRYSSDQRSNQNDPNASQNANAVQRLGATWSNSNNGLVARRVSDDTPLGQAGLERGDEIVAIGDRHVRSQAELQQALVAQAGSRVALIVNRDGNHQTLYVVAPGWLAGYGNRGNGNSGYATQASNNESYAQDSRSQHAFLGVLLDPRQTHQAVVRQVYQDSPAAAARVQPGDTIVSVNGQRINSADDLTNAISELQPGATINLAVSHTQSRNVQVRLGSRGQQQGQTNANQDRDQNQSRSSNNVRQANFADEEANADMPSNDEGEGNFRNRDNADNTD